MAPGSAWRSVVEFPERGFSNQISAYCGGQSGWCSLWSLGLVGDGPVGKVAVPQVGGLHHRFHRSSRQTSTTSMSRWRAVSTIFSRSSCAEAPAPISRPCMATAQSRRAAYSRRARSCRGMVDGGDAGVKAGTKHFRGLPWLGHKPLTGLALRESAGTQINRLFARTIMANDAALFHMIERAYTLLHCPTKHRNQEARSGVLIHMHDLALAIRLLRKSPAFTLLALLCLALGIGVNASIFSLLDSVYLRPLPVGNADRVVVLSRGGSPLFPYPEYRALRDRNQSLDGLAVSEPEESDLSFEGNAMLIGAEPVSANYAAVLGARTSLGRWFTREDEPSSATTHGSSSFMATPACSERPSARNRTRIPWSGSRRRSSPASTRRCASIFGCPSATGPAMMPITAVPWCSAA